MGNTQKNKSKWTEEDLAILEKYRHLGAKKVAKKLKRTPVAVARRMWLESKKSKVEVEVKEDSMPDFLEEAVQQMHEMSEVTNETIELIEKKIENAEAQKLAIMGSIEAYKDLLSDLKYNEWCRKADLEKKKKKKNA